MKRIPKSDISIRPFKAYKEWTFTTASAEISLFEAEAGTYNLTTKTTSNGLSFYKNALHGQLSGQFYNGQEDNPFLRFGRKTNVWTDVDAEKERYLNTTAKVISIPQKYVGEGIKPGSFTITITDNTNTTWEFKDDSYGNITFDSWDIIDVKLLDFQTGQFNFTNYRTGTPYSTSVDNNNWNLDNGEIRVTYNSTDYDTIIYSWDANATPSLMYVRNLPFLDSLYGSLYMGNVFYAQGVVTITRAVTSLLNRNWTINYKSTETIYENEYLLVANEGEFNVSTNPTAIVIRDEVVEDFTATDGKTYKVTTKPGIRYVRKRQVTNSGEFMDFSYTSSINPAISGGFEQIYISGSIDKTGSYLAPFITTIGLYDDACNLLAVAKLPTPIKSLPDYPINFIVRFDT